MLPLSGRLPPSLSRDVVGMESVTPLLGAGGAGRPGTGLPNDPGASALLLKMMPLMLGNLPSFLFYLRN
jgi:hypothetical protein